MTESAFRGSVIAGLLGLGLAGAAAAQNAPESLKVHFDTGSAAIAADQRATLDQAARLFRDGNPIVMIVAGVADTTGSPLRNLQLSLDRADAVAQGLTERGIPADRLQVLGRGNSELAVKTGADVDEPGNRIAEITWR
jgi:outer membrane protein OmpA-like peptidoglycan-associated protein